MITLKFNNAIELAAFLEFLKDNKDHLRKKLHPVFQITIRSLVLEIERKLIPKLYLELRTFKISLKTHDAIALYSVYRYTTKAQPSTFDFSYNIVRQKMDFLHQKMQGKQDLSLISKSK